MSGKLATRRATAARLTELSNLLPKLAGRVVYSSQQVNLKAFGFGGFQGIPSIVGPFEVLDVRAALNQAIIDVRAWQAWIAGASDCLPSESERCRSCSTKASRKTG